jgi:hypothetical protein
MTCLDFNLDIHTRRKVEPHQHINRLGIWIEYIDQTVVRADFKMLMRVFVNESRAAYCKPFYLGWQGYRANYVGTRSLGCFDNPLGRLVEDSMIICLKADADFLFGHIILPIR